MNSNFINAKLSKYFSNDYSDLEWLTVKISLVATLCLFLLYILYTRSTQPFPSGICRFVNCAYLTEGYVRVAVTSFLVVLSVIYVLEVRMLFCTFFLFILAVVILSLEESNGNPAENGILSLIFLAQFFAYLFNRFNPQSGLSKNRIQFSAQIFAAAYTLAAISKLNASGLSWFTNDAPKFALEVLRVFNSKYVTDGLIEHQNKGFAIATFVSNHPLLIKIFLGGALLLELCTFVLMLGKKPAFIYSILLLSFHIGTYFSMDIFFPTISLPMIILFINPLFWLLVILMYMDKATYLKNKKLSIF